MCCLVVVAAVVLPIVLLIRPRRASARTGGSVPAGEGWHSQLDTITCDCMV